MPGHSGDRRRRAAVIEISDFLSSLLAGGIGRAGSRSAISWMRLVPKPATGSAGAGYAPATINHNLAVLKGFYMTGSRRALVR
jgi:hypothetical protein